MTIRAGEDWGIPVSSAPPNAVVGYSDSDVAVSIAAGQPVIVRGGSLHSSLGAPAGQDVTRRMMVDAIDVRRIDNGERLGLAIANVLIRRRLFGVLRGRAILVSNCGEFKGVNACPRAHPNDGRLDRLDLDHAMSLRQRRLAWRRATSGSHLPHPQLTASVGESFEMSLHPNEEIVVDGHSRRVTGGAIVTVIPDAGEIFI
ncbi:MAG: hypothetical protein ACO35F_08405 [Ilumatobacteraceae bacterium]